MLGTPLVHLSVNLCKVSITVKLFSSLSTFTFQQAREHYFMVLIIIKVRSWSTATQLRYRCIDYLSIAGHRNALHLKLKLLYRIAVVGAETAIRVLQLTATHLQWTMNASFHL